MKRLNGMFWPEEDTKLAQVFDWVSDIAEIVKHCDRFDVCVQAGGACGQWPSEFAKHFKTVVTCEPEASNMECLLLNIPDNVTAYRQALGEKPGFVDMRRDDFEEGNAGAWYAVDGTEIHSGTIDTMNLNGCDLIQLDLEGGEAAAIRGGINTIKQYQPVIVIEEKRLPHMKVDPREARRILESLGYKAVAKLHKDVVFKC